MKTWARTFKYLFLISCIVFSSILCAESLPKAGIKEIHINDKILLPPFNQITLQPDDDDLFIYFDVDTSVDAYEFQLIGLDKFPVTLEFPYTRYTNLTGNDYVFALSTIKETDTSEVMLLPIKVLPKTTESSWFFPALLVYVSLVVFALAFFWLMYDFRQKMRLQKIRNQIAGDLHDEVGSTLSSIAVFSKALKRNIKKPEAIATLDNIIHSAEQTNSNLHDTVWSLNPELDKAGDLFEKIRSIAFQVFTAKNVQLAFNADFAAIKGVKISMLHRRNVYLMACEAINNIIKHSEASEVIISINKEGRKIRFIIQDKGKGFDLNNVKKGNGLKNFYRRAKDSFIKFNLKSQFDEGTTITMLIPQL